MHTNSNSHPYFDEQASLATGGISQQRLLTYIRPLIPSEGNGYAVCSEQGEVLACFPNYQAAFFTARQFHLTPQAVH